MIDSYAQIVGLMSAYSASRSGNEMMDELSFQSWLIKHNHQDIVKLLNTNASTAIFVKSFLNRELPLIQLKLDTLTSLVESLVDQNSEEDHLSPSNIKYVKGVFMLFLERDLPNRYKIDNLDVLNSYMKDLFYSENIPINEYVLNQILRECLEFKDTVYSIVNKHWYALLV